MDQRILVVAVCGAVSGVADVATTIEDAISDLFNMAGYDSDVEPSVVINRLTGQAATETISAASHLVITVGGQPGQWADVSVAWLEEARVLVDERLVPWVTKWQAGRRAPRAQTAVLAQPDPDWANAAARLIGRLRHHTAGLPVVRIDHIGSTSVAGLAAKDLIDIQITVADDDHAPLVAEASTGAGFVHVKGTWHGKDRNGEPHPEQVCVDADPARPVNINIRSADRPVARDALLFRDWLRANPDARDRYQAMKSKLAGRHVDDYGDSKEPFISTALHEAETWAARTR